MTASSQSTQVGVFFKEWLLTESLISLTFRTDRAECHSAVLHLYSPWFSLESEPWLVTQQFQVIIKKLPFVSNLYIHDSIHTVDMSLPLYLKHLTFSTTAAHSGNVKRLCAPDIVPVLAAPATVASLFNKGMVCAKCLSMAEFLKNPQGYRISIPN